MEHIETQSVARSAMRLIMWIYAATFVLQTFVFGALFVFANDANAIWPWLAVSVVFLLLYALMRESTLFVRIDADGVFVKARFFHRNGRLIAWSDVKDVTLRPLRAFGEFGGWGIRYVFFKTGYIWDGDRCIDLHLKNGRRVVVSLTDVDGCAQALHAMGRAYTRR